MKLLAAIALSVLFMGGCTHLAGGPTDQTYAGLERNCRARGGVLVPIPGANSVNPAANFACRFSGEAGEPG